MPPWLPPLLAAPVIGSFAGVLIRRLPTGRPVALARSQCEACGHVLSPAELVPLLSILVLRGRCRACGAAIPRFHVLVELAALLVAVSAVLAPLLLAAALPNGSGAAPSAAAGLVSGGALQGGALGSGTQAGAAGLWADCALGWTLLALAWIDARHFLLPDVLTLPLLLAGLAACQVLQPWALQDHLLGAVLGYAVLRAVALAYRALRGRDGVGAGDAKLLAACGAWLGWAALPQVLLLAALLGLGAAGVMRLRGRVVERTTMLPFGPFLAAACWAVRLSGSWAGP